jgi:aminoglycoside 6'-N-acetyltransferase I
MRVREAKDGDVDAVCALAMAFYREDGFSTGDAELARNLAVLHRSSAARVAVVDGADALSGFAITTTSFGLEYGLVAELEDLYVAPAMRHKGIAALLVADSAAWATELGASVLEIIVAPHGRDPMRLLDYYTRLGFTDEGRRLLSMPL